MIQPARHKLLISRYLKSGKFYYLWTTTNFHCILNWQLHFWQEDRRAFISGKNRFHWDHDIFVDTHTSLAVPGKMACTFKTCIWAWYLDEGYSYFVCILSEWVATCTQPEESYPNSSPHHWLQSQPRLGPRTLCRSSQEAKLSVSTIVQMGSKDWEGVKKTPTQRACKQELCEWNVCLIKDTKYSSELLVCR